MNWNWDHIRFFLALAEHGTLSLAGQSIGVSHSTVLRRIRAFEEQLQTKLFNHTHAGYTLTRAGQALHAEAVKMQGTLSAISRDITGADNQMQGEIVVTTTDTLARYVLPKLMAKFTAAYPDIQFSLYMTNDMSDIANREADIAIRTGKTPPNDLIGKKVAEISFSAVASPGYIDSSGLQSFPGKGMAHRYILLNEAYSAAPFYQWLLKHVNADDTVTKVNNFLTAAALAREGMGVTVLPSYMVQNDPELIGLNTKDKISHNDLWVLSHADLRDTEKVRMARQYFYDELPKVLNLP